jgi:acetate kinase
VQVLVINSGSSSIKFELFAMESERSVMRGAVERIGLADPTMWVEVLDDGAGLRTGSVHAADHAQAMRFVLGAIQKVAGEPAEATSEIAAVAHRVVHGGKRHTEPTLVDATVLADIRELELLAPVHVRANVVGIEAALATFPTVPHVAVFDTAFHHTIPPVAHAYALPRELAEKYGLRRYGFHGTSHAFVAQRAAALLEKPLAELNLITLHLGNGASATAIRGGESVDTSMGMTPLEGLIMGTRCGDIDPAIPGLLGELAEMTREDVNHLLNFESGLKGLCGASDMREVHKRAAAGDGGAELAREAFCYRVKKYIGAYFAVLGRVDAMVFTAGIGEHDPYVRAVICEGLERFGVTLDAKRNSVATGTTRRERIISSPESEVVVLVIPTDEEFELARTALACLSLTPDRKA